MKKPWFWKEPRFLHPGCSIIRASLTVANIGVPCAAAHSPCICSQKRILEAYAKQNGFTNLRWYTDDGYSGANFQRPGFQAMLADIEAGKVGTVIVKDYCAIIGLNQKDLENQGILA